MFGVGGFCARFKFGGLLMRVGELWWLMFSWVVWLIVGFVWVDFVALRVVCFVSFAGNAGVGFEFCAGCLTVFVSLGLMGLIVVLPFVLRLGVSRIWVFCDCCIVCAWE